MDIHPYRVDVDQAVLDDLHNRLRHTRWVDVPEGASWDYGVDIAYLRLLVEHWLERYDWRAVEAELNQMPHFQAEVDGIDLHFVHQTGTGPDPLAIVLVHGWPSGFPEMTKLIPLLADPASHGGDPADAFHVVVPSLPGFGFSSRAKAVGFGYYRAAMALHEILTAGLGYSRYGTHGTGLGAYVNGWLAYEHPEAVVGFHGHDLGMVPLQDLNAPGARPLDEEEQAHYARSADWAKREGAYAELQRTKPQALGQALNDSPAGLLGWLVEKHRMWSDCGGDVERRYTRDELVTQAMVYWTQGNVASPLRAYLERVRFDPPLVPGRPLGVPSGVAITRYQPSNPPRALPRQLAERTHDLRQWVELPRGGHFASWEEPELVAAAIRDFYRPLR